MPIKIPDDLPAFDILVKENIFVMGSTGISPGHQTA